MPMRRMPLLVSLSLILAGCGSADVGTASPSPVTPAGSELSGSPLPSETGVADDPSGTLTIIPNTQADGPGQSVRSSIARAPVQMALVNGWLLIDADGTMWLCEALITSDHLVATARDCGWKATRRRNSTTSDNWATSENRAGYIGCRNEPRGLGT